MNLFHLVILSGLWPTTFPVCSDPVGWGEGDTVETRENKFPHFSNFARAGDKDLLTKQVVKKIEVFIFNLKGEKK